MTLVEAFAEVDRIIDKYYFSNPIQFRYEKTLLNHRYAKFVVFKDNEILHVFGGSAEKLEDAIKMAVAKIETEYKVII